MMNPLLFADDRTVVELEKAKASSYLESAGIMKSKRIIYFIVEKKDFDAANRGEVNIHRPPCGVAFLVNLSISDSHKSFTNHIKTPNSTLINMNIHTFDVLFANGMFNAKEGVFTFRNAYSSEIIDRFHYENGMRSEDVSDIAICSRGVHDFGNPLIGSFLGDDIPIIAPAPFYNPYHMWRTTGDYYGLADESTVMSEVFRGHELVDPFTEIKYIDIQKWDPLFCEHFSIFKDPQSEFPMAMGKTFLVDGESERQMIRRMFESSSIVTSMFDDMTLVYDTQMGVTKLSNGTVPFLSYRNKENVINEIKFSIENLKATAHEIERERGSIRIMYTPLLIGDKMKIIYKDHDFKPDIIHSIDRDFTTRTVAVDVGEDLRNEEEYYHGEPFTDLPF